MSHSPRISNSELDCVSVRAFPSGDRVTTPANVDPLDSTATDDAQYRGAIENFAGVVRLPVGMAGPIRVRGRFVNGMYPFPLGTTEAALVASYHRGCSLISEAGGCDVALTADCISRAPGFVFDNLSDACAFSDWIGTRFDTLQQVAATTTSYGQLINIQPNIEGRSVYLQLGFTTGDAAGQNMVTIATEAICAFIESQCPVKPQRWYIEANHCGDKKACGQSLASVRGKRVTGEVVIPANLLQRRLRVSPQELTAIWRMGAVGGAMIGAMGIQSQFANGLAALFIACGQDVACVAESAVGVTRVEVNEDGDLYGSVTLPNLVVGTVGGGTALPDQSRYLESIGLPSENSACALAELAAALCMAGELSLGAAICSGDFTRAHRTLARRRTARPNQQEHEEDLK